MKETNKSIEGFTEEEIIAAKSYGLENPKEIWEVLSNTYEHWEKWNEESRQDTYREFVKTWQPLQETDIKDAAKSLNVDGEAGLKQYFAKNFGLENNSERYREEMWRGFIRGNAELWRKPKERKEN